MLEKYMKYHLEYNRFSRSDADCMPIGNGRMAINFRVDDQGVIEFPVAHLEAWDEHHRLLKLVKFRLSTLTPLSEDGWSQKLIPEESRVVFQGKDQKGQAVSGYAWIDSQTDTLQLKIDYQDQIQVKLINWRTENRAFLKGEDHCTSFYQQEPEKHQCTKDEALPPKLSPYSSIGTYHRNEYSPYEANLKQQGLAEVLDWDEMKDPILHRTSGISLTTNTLEVISNTEVTSSGPHHEIRVTAHVGQYSSIESWGADLVKKQEDFELHQAEYYSQHLEWWQSQHEKSYIFVSGDESAEQLTMAYIYQRYLFLCSGRSEFPIKFNGSIFTCDPSSEGSFFQKEDCLNYSPDFRLWGGGYWFQNTRLAYWTMLKSGDLEMMPAFFDLHLKNMKLAQLRSEEYFGHQGVFFPETQTLWGTYLNENYGHNREDLDYGDPTTINEYIRFHYNNTLEMLYMMLCYHEMKQDTSYFKKSILPYAHEVLTWWLEHWSTDEGWKIFPGYSCETYWNVENPTPDIAGIQACCQKLKELSDDIVESDLKEIIDQLNKVCPEIPIDKNHCILPCHGEVPKPSNFENPELYSIFPFQLHGLGQGDLELAQNSFSKRKFPDHFGWQQNGSFAALVGDAKEAKKDLLERLNLKHRDSWFPALWQSNYDWAPDQDHGANLVLTLQNMVLQSWGKEDYQLPAWPKEWQVEAKLHSTNGALFISMELSSFQYQGE